MSLSRPGDFFESKKNEEELALRAEEERRALAEENKRLKKPSKVLGEQVALPIFPEREVVKKIPQDIIERVVVKVEEASHPIEESISIVSREVNNKADIASVVSIQESVSEYVERINDRIDSLDIRHYEKEIDGIYDNLGELADAVDSNLDHLSKLSGRSVEELRDEFSVMFKELQESLTAATERASANREELLELQENLKLSVEDIPNQESRFDPQPILESVEALRESLTINISESNQSLNEKVDGLDIRYYEEDLASIQKFAEEVKESIKYYDTDVEALTKSIDSAEEAKRNCN